ncbi:hypothetical protein B0H66DRAFT_565509 [Apodospora peruviana]|uniref:Uncharacterized protein n=1 Tax=Apodospora peruviana TaxID=516989 RepID=A0AAE0HZ69_9PEZI|nr:hypothetical protein B0H66DRAFT_565509 [Apodospora peruviana]
MRSGNNKMSDCDSDVSISPAARKSHANLHVVATPQFFAYFQRRIDAWHDLVDDRIDEVRKEDLEKTRAWVSQVQDKLEEEQNRLAADNLREQESWAQDLEDRDQEHQMELQGVGSRWSERLRRCREARGEELETLREEVLELKSDQKLAWRMHAVERKKAADLEAEVKKLWEQVLDSSSRADDKTAAQEVEKEVEYLMLATGMGLGM